ncbi:MAG: 50S ribosomal protein L3 [Rickettsiaceae bacterium]|nr:50S ribosomal protein L3 [Rickettsiaceae bacterium]
MRSGLIAEKVGMTSTFNEKGERVPVTLLRVQDCQVVGYRTSEKDGYNALIIGAKNAKPSKVSKAMRTVFANAKVEPKVHLKEFRISEDAYMEVGAALTVEHFSVGQVVDVSGVSIGKGFAGGMKRHNFRGLEASHGVSVSHRSIGSTGGCQDPGRTFKNKKMPGHLGHEKVTVQNLTVVAVNAEEGVLVVKGAIPGHKGAGVYVTDAVKKTIAI